MKILLRHLGGKDDGTRKEYVDLEQIPHANEEIHWENRILRVIKTMHFPGPKLGPVACCYVEELR